MQQKWYITLEMDTEDLDEFEAYLELVEQNLLNSCSLAGIEITDFEQN